MLFVDGILRGMFQMTTFGLLRSGQCGTSMADLNG